MTLAEILVYTHAWSSAYASHSENPPERVRYGSDQDKEAWRANAAKEAAHDARVAATAFGRLCQVGVHELDAAFGKAAQRGPIECKGS